jgi:hypothetical protein
MNANSFIVIVLKKSAVAKKHVFGSDGLVAGMDCQTLACALEIMLLMPAILTPNGTAIGVVCVTGAANRLIVQFVGMELSRWQAGMAQYLQSRVRLVSRSRYDDERY